MSTSEWGRSAVYIFMASVAALFTMRMWIRARKASGGFAIPPHWYDVVALYLSSWVVLGYGIALRIFLGDHWTDHSRFLLGCFYQGYAFIVTAVALYYWVKPSMMVTPPPAPEER
jgi:hypothetical protein